MEGAISPVKAPFSSQKRFWAASWMGEPSSSFRTAERAVKGGATATSTPSTPDKEAFNCLTRSMASATVLFIFQLPAIKGSLFINQSPPPQGFNPGQFLPLKKFKGGSATR